MARTSTGSPSGTAHATWPSPRSASTTRRLPSGSSARSPAAWCQGGRRSSRSSRPTATGSSTGSSPHLGWTPPRWPGRACTPPLTAATSRTLPPASLAVRQVDPRNPPVHVPGTRRRGRVPGHLTQVRPARHPGRQPGRAGGALRRRLPDAAAHDDLRRHLPGRPADEPQHREHPGLHQALREPAPPGTARRPTTGGSPRLAVPVRLPGSCRAETGSTWPSSTSTAATPCPADLPMLAATSAICTARAREGTAPGAAAPAHTAPQAGPCAARLPGRAPRTPSPGNCGRAASRDARLTVRQAQRTDRGRRRPGGVLQGRQPAELPHHPGREPGHDRLRRPDSRPVRLRPRQAHRHPRHDPRPDSRRQASPPP